MRLLGEAGTGGTRTMTGNKTMPHVTTRETFLLNVIGWLYDQDGWYLDQYPEWKKRLRDEYGVSWFDSEDDEGLNA